MGKRRELSRNYTPISRELSSALVEMNFEIEKSIQTQSDNQNESKSKSKSKDMNKSENINAEKKREESTQQQQQQQQCKQQQQQQQQSPREQSGWFKNRRSGRNRLGLVGSLQNLHERANFHYFTRSSKGINTNTNINTNMNTNTSIDTNKLNITRTDNEKKLKNINSNINLGIGGGGKSKGNERTLGKMKSLSAISTRELSLDSKTKRNGLKRYRESSNQTSNNEELERHKLRALTRRVHENWDEVDKSLEELRTLIVTNGGLPIEIAKNASSSTKGTDIKSKNDSNESCVEMEKFSNDKFGIGDSKYGDKEGDEISKINREYNEQRGKLWLLLLRIQKIPVEEYLRELNKCPSPSHSKIKDDVFRTLATDEVFKAAVSDNKMIRILNATVVRRIGSIARYVQGMNVLLAPFAYVMNEPAAYFCFVRFLEQRCPLYATPNLPGVHAGAVLVDEVLSLVDPPLYAHLSSHGITGRIYAFPAVMTISACIPPLNQVLKLWDYFLACGVHLNILCIVALVISIRDLLLTTTNPSSVLRHWPPLNASSLIRKSRFLLSQLPHHILFLLENHLCDFDLACKISAHDPSLNLNILAANTSADNSLLCNYPISSTTPRLTSYTASSNSNLASSVSSTFVAAKRRKMPTNLGLSLTDSTSPFPTQFTHLQNNHQQLHSNLDSITNPSSLANKNNDTGPNTRQRNRIRLDLQNWISNR